MGIVERKEREREEMRKLILDAAQKLFIANGYEKVSIRNIADEIEYSPATIYLYFKDKNQLLFAPVLYRLLPPSVTKKTVPASEEEPVLASVQEL